MQLLGSTDAEELSIDAYEATKKDMGKQYKDIANAMKQSQQCFIFNGESAFRDRLFIGVLKQAISKHKPWIEYCMESRVFEKKLTAKFGQFKKGKEQAEFVIQLLRESFLPGIRKKYFDTLTKAISIGVLQLLFLPPTNKPQFFIIDNKLFLEKLHVPGTPKEAWFLKNLHPVFQWQYKLQFLIIKKSALSLNKWWPLSK